MRGLIAPDVVEKALVADELAHQQVLNYNLYRC